MKRTTLARLHVHRLPGDRRRGRLVAGTLIVPCALGRGGPTHQKREGDGGTPVGRFRLLGVSFRPDRMPRPRTLLALKAIRPDDGWCDDPRDRRYNRPIRVPDKAGHERMWRDDGLYDVVVDIAWNRGPIRRGRGSAIFLHLAKGGFGPTEGCIALSRPALRRLLTQLGPRTRIEIVG